MSRTLRSLLIAGLLGSTLVIGGAVRAADEGGGKCKVATKPETDVGKACAAGGIKAAKAKMKEMVKAAKANGTKFQCDDCHIDDADFGKMADDSKDKFKKLMAALVKK